jgi:hypothetical protein
MLPGCHQVSTVVNAPQRQRSQRNTARPCDRGREQRSQGRGSQGSDDMDRNAARYGRPCNVSVHQSSSATPHPDRRTGTVHRMEHHHARLWSRYSQQSLDHNLNVAKPRPTGYVQDYVERYAHTLQDADLRLCSGAKGNRTPDLFHAMHTTNRLSRPAASRGGHPRPIVSDRRTARERRRQVVNRPMRAHTSVAVACCPVTSKRSSVATLLATSV